MKTIYFVQNNDDEAYFFDFLRSFENDISPYSSSFVNGKWIYTRISFTDMLSVKHRDRYIYQGKIRRRY